MKVVIKNYATWFGPYQLTDLIPFLSEDKRYELGNRYAKTCVGKLHTKVAQKYLDWQGSRRIHVHIDKWDTWNMDSTLCHIILPMLRQLKEAKHGAPYTDDMDVPEEIRSTAAFPVENEWDTDEFFFKRWDWIMDEMIYAFQTKIEDEDFGVNARRDNGFYLFGKYYQSLWD